MNLLDNIKGEMSGIEALVSKIPAAHSEDST